jgi:chemotaxis protein histidine kinase CheA
MIDQEILADFQAEAKGLLDELENVVELLEDAGGDFPDQELEHFAQRIDRIMGAAQTLSMLEPEHQGLVRIGAIAQICKRTGYRAAAAKRADLVPLFAAFWADTIDILRDLIDAVGDEAESARLANSSGKSLLTRLNWLSGKLGNEAPATDQSQLDDLLKQLE